MADPEDSGIDLSKLKPGTWIEAKTKNNVYEITILGDGKVKIKGGKYFSEPVERYFHGSTWGGSIIRANWIGYLMNMEIENKPRRRPIITTPVRSAVVHGNGWEYKMEWPS